MPGVSGVPLRRPRRPLAGYSMGLSGCGPTGRSIPLPISDRQPVPTKKFFSATAVDSIDKNVDSGQSLLAPGVIRLAYLETTEKSIGPFEPLVFCVHHY